MLPLMFFRLSFFFGIFKFLSVAHFVLCFDIIKVYIIYIMSLIFHIKINLVHVHYTDNTNIA